MAGIDHLHNDFPEGCQVTLRLRGLALGESHGVLQAGRMPAGSGFATDYIGSKAALDAAVTRNGEALEPIAPLLSSGELTPERCGTLVRIGAALHPGRPYARDMGRIQAFHGRHRRGGLHLCTQLRPVCGRRGTRRPLYASRESCNTTPPGKGRYILKLRDENDCTR